MFEAKIVDSNRELTAREKISFKDISNSEILDEVVKAGEKYTVTIDTVALVDIKNDKSETGEYTVTVFTDTDGRKYRTSSSSFENAIFDIINELKDNNDTEPITIEIFKKKSKNYTGDFITCSLI